MLWSFRGTMERRDGHDVYDQGGSSAPSTSGVPCLWFVAATATTTIATSEDVAPDMQKRMAKMGRL